MLLPNSSYQSQIGEADFGAKTRVGLPLDQIDQEMMGFTQNDGGNPN